jgi:hypothetical protein
MSLIRSPAWWCGERTMNYLRASIEGMFFAQEELYSNLSDLLFWLFEEEIWQHKVKQGAWKPAFGNDLNLYI